jgi:nucleoside phosphorylase
VKAGARALEIVKAFGKKTYFLVGCAVGRRGLTKILDVVISTGGIYNYDFKYALGDKRGHVPEMWKPDKDLSRDLGQFFSSKAHTRGWKDHLLIALASLDAAGLKLPQLEDNPRAHFRVIASGNLILDESHMAQLVAMNDEVYAGEQEGSGFANTCDEQDVRWMVVRGISDYGAEEDRDKWKTAAAASAATYVRAYLASCTR